MTRFRLICCVVFGTLVMSIGCQNPATAPTPSVSGVLPRTETVSQPIVTVVDVSGQLTMTSRNYVGQSVTIPGTAAVGNIRFNWYTYKTSTDQQARNETPTAFGTLYVLNQEYLGVPAGLSSSTPGYVGRSASIADGQYLFTPSLTLAPGVRYWFYADAGGSFVTSFNVSSYPGGDMYNTGQTDPTFPVQPFRKSAASWLAQPGGGYLIPPPGTFQDADFKLQGSLGGS